jgi:hypothetical protein
MIMRLRFLLALLVSLAASTAAAADKTDLWWNPAESGWGMTIANQGDTIFVTLYAYGADNNPTWFVGTASLASTDQGVNTYTGDWYRVTGPAYSAPTFDPATVNATKVGTYTFREFTATAGQIAYTVNGVTYTKNVQRQTLAQNPLASGSYRGWYFSTVTGNCAGSGNSAAAINLSLANSGSSAQLGVSFTASGGACSLTGLYAQAGRMGVLNGAWSCSNGNRGSATFSEIEAGRQGLTARFTMTYETPGCTESGYLGTARLGL